MFVVIQFYIWNLEEVCDSKKCYLNEWVRFTHYYINQYVGLVQGFNERILVYRLMSVLWIIEIIRNVERLLKVTSMKSSRIFLKCLFNSFFIIKIYLIVIFLCVKKDKYIYITVFFNFHRFSNSSLFISWASPVLRYRCYVCPELLLLGNR